MYEYFNSAEKHDTRLESRLKMKNICWIDCVELATAETAQKVSKFVA